MAKPLINNVKRGKLVEKEGGFLDYEKQPLDYISCYSSHFLKSNKDHSSRSTKQVGQAVKVPRIKGADKIISTLCREHEAKDQKKQEPAGSITKTDDEDCGKTDSTWSRSWAELKRVQRNRKSRFI